jgi:hypothetical protein
MKEYLTQSQLENIKHHSYKSAGYSKLDYKMNPFWEFCAKCLPFVRLYNQGSNPQYGNTTWSILSNDRNYCNTIL